MTEPDFLTESLADLRVDPPHELLDRITARWSRVEAPMGPLYVASTDEGISYVRIGAAVHDTDAEFVASFRERFRRPLLASDRPPAGLLPALRTGKGTGLTFDLRGCTEFERDVLRAAQRIPAGQVRPYGWIAHQIGRPKAVRAVGSALGHNPVPILIPCHRVVRSDGDLGEYVFNRPVKESLLASEGTNLAELAGMAGRGSHYVASDTTGIVCFPSCAAARRITPAHRHEFRTVAAAERAGFRTCRLCQPVSAA
ncbi:MAG TPA: methylated-DNA--[protein]-cysteine S-methyltransferase [Micromonosporaceae bacterium]|jgi:O-6-methylguanine DNA methyltransferase